MQHLRLQLCDFPPRGGLERGAPLKRFLQLFLPAHHLPLQFPQHRSQVVDFYLLQLYLELVFLRAIELPLPQRKGNLLRLLVVNKGGKAFVLENSHKECRK